MSRSSAVLRETEIRPDELMDGQRERVAADIRWLLDHRSEFVKVPCPACGSEESAEAFQKTELHYVTCLQCETLYVNPRPPAAVLESFYAQSVNYAYWNKCIFPASEDARREGIFRPRAERLAEICRRHQIRTRVLLEVGAGFGTFCEETRRLGIFERIIGVEPTPDLAQTCRNKGVEVVEQPIEQVNLENVIVDVVASFEVIEHLFCPRDFLRVCSAILSPGGLLLLTCPNVKGFDVMVLREHSNTVDHEHLNYFHPASLSRLVADCGLEPLEVLTPGKLDAELVRKKILSGEFDASNQPFIRQILIDEWERIGDRFQSFLAENMLSSHMWLVARKPA